jgi:uncharacterized protein (DUF2267 family)
LAKPGGTDFRGLWSRRVCGQCRVDRLPLGLAAHLGAQLPLLVRGTYYDQFQPGHDVGRVASEDKFLARVNSEFDGIRPVNARLATQSVLSVRARHVSPGLAEKVRDALPGHIRTLWTKAEETT